MTSALPAFTDDEIADILRVEEDIAAELAAASGARAGSAAPAAPCDGAPAVSAGGGLATSALSVHAGGDPPPVVADTPGSVLTDRNPRSPAETLRLQLQQLAQGPAQEALVLQRRARVLDLERARHCVSIGETSLHFPFADGPLKPQRQLMENVVEALSCGKHAVLESPTGTGKTAAVLCAALAWQKRQREVAGTAAQIVYASRTHFQLRQTVAELRRLPYRPVMAVIGSRESGLCVHPQVSASSSVRQACRHHRRAGTCSFYEALSSEGAATRASEALLQGDAWDIEDIAAFGRSCGMCPYYTCHAVAESADLILCPYNYLLDPAVRRAAGPSLRDLSGRVVVFDEAHNVEGVCREAGSTRLGLRETRGAISALRRALEGLGAPAPEAPSAPRATRSSEAPPSRQRRAALDDMGGFLTEAGSGPAPYRPASARGPGLADDAPDRGDLAPPSRPQPAARVSGPLAQAARSLIALLSRLCDFLAESKEVCVYAPHFGPDRQVASLLAHLGLQREPLLGPPRVDSGISAAAQPLSAFAAAMAGTHGEVVIGELMGRCADQGAALEAVAGVLSQLAAAVASPHLYAAQVDPQDSVLHLWLMLAEGTLASVASAARSVVMISGTLAPMAATMSELGPTFRARAIAPMEAEHVVDRRQLRLVTVAHAGDAASTKLECNFQAWKRRDFLLCIGRTVASLAGEIPGGVLVFLPNYDLLEQCVQSWQAQAEGKKKRSKAVERIVEADATSIWAQMASAKGTVVLEPPPLRELAMHGPQQAKPFEAARAQYEDAVRRDGRALLLAVYRGRMSEGLSFDDDYARGVICVGIPFPSLKEERLVQKRAFNDFWLSKGEPVVSGNIWYEMKAFQAVAQALGRCIRHPSDYGALVLLDSRWAELGKVSGLPRWLQPFAEEQLDAPGACASLRRHFEALRCEPPARLRTPGVDPGPLPASQAQAAAPPSEPQRPAVAGVPVGASVPLLQRPKAFGKLRAPARGCAPCIDLE